MFKRETLQCLSGHMDVPLLRTTTLGPTYNIKLLNLQTAAVRTNIKLTINFCSHGYQGKKFDVVSWLPR